MTESALGDKISEIIACSIIIVRRNGKAYEVDSNETTSGPRDSDAS